MYGLAFTFIRPISSYRSQRQGLGRFAFREEIHYNRYFLKYVATFYIAFFVVDWVYAGVSPIYSVGLRAAAVGVSYSFFQLLRGRTKYLTRSIATCAPFYYVLEFLAIANDLVLSPYIIGYALVAFTNVVFFPARFKFALIQQAIYGLPLATYLLFSLTHDFENRDFLLTMVMLNVGLVVLASLCSEVSYNEIRKRYIQYEKLVVQNRSKAEEIARRAKELSRYQVFKNQLSSEVASIALSDPKNLAKRYSNIVTIVFDIKDSTNRSFSLNLQDYDHVVEETVEIFAQACSRAHITVDKYIGDGVQAFVGAPVAMSIEKGIFTALRAISDAKSELDARRDELEAFWQRRLQVKFSITVGEALVGFHGKSAIQNYTATGPYVSLAHRLCGLASEDEIAFHASDESLVPRDLLRCESFVTSSIKGLDEIRSLESGIVEQEAREIRVFKIPVDFVKPEKNSESIGDCAKCSRPLYLSESPTGLPKAYSTECESANCQYSIDGLTRIFVKTSDAA